MNRNNHKIMKDCIRTIGIDDAAFQRKASKKTFVFGVIVRGYNLVEGILRTTVEVDGWDATEKVSEMIVSSKYVTQLRAIILGSSTIAAFNIIDLRKLFDITDIPVITILSTLPNEEDVKTALSNLENWSEKYNVLSSNPAIEEISFKNQIGKQYKKFIQQVGFTNIEQVRKVIEISTHSSSIPECLRLADMIGQSFKNYKI
ncbi:MAG: endonuclease dU [Candidatus Heimdallarchaeaceae archaeon]